MKSSYRTRKQYIKKSCVPATLCLSSLCLSLLIINQAIADDYFDISALDSRATGQVADIKNLNAFSQKNGQLPGLYNVDIYVNNQLVGIEKIDFVTIEGLGLQPKLTKKMLMEWGINSAASAQLEKLPDDSVITSLPDYITGAVISSDVSIQRLSLTIPQAAVKNIPRGYVSPKLWENGVPAMMLSYIFNGSNTRDKNGSNTHYEFLSLNSGINVGAWRLRNSSTYNKSKYESTWRSIQTYIERALPEIQSRFIAGETTTESGIFDSFSFKGLKLLSDDSMLPASMRGYAPVIRGIANSNARVLVRQNGYVLYETYVPPGPFVINDLYSSTANGNLEVSVEEQNGSVSSFIVPFSSLPNLQREGHLKYAVSGGKYTGSYDQRKEPHFIQAIAEYGMPGNITLFGGGLFSEDYVSASVGAGVSLGKFGALSAGLTQAQTKLTKDGKKARYNGQSLNIQYAKNLAETGTTVTMAGYRYSSEDFYDFNEANNNFYGEQGNNRYTRRSKIQINLNQTLGNYGSFYLGAYTQDYWNNSQEKTLSAGFYSSYNSVSYGINYAYSKYSNDYSRDNDHQISLSLSIPLDSVIPNMYFSSTLSSDSDGRNNIMAGVSGSAMDNRLSYNIQQSLGNKGQNASSSISSSYRGSNGILNAGYGYDKNSSRLNYGVSGGAVLYSDGLVLAQQLNETIAVLDAPGTDGARISGITGIATNEAGKVVVPYLTPYQRNDIRLDMESLGPDVDLVNNTAYVIPTRGAVVTTRLDTRSGLRALIKLTQSNGESIPFGAVATVKGDGLVGSENTGIVNETGEVYLSGLPESGSIGVKWGQSIDERCTASYRLPEKIGDNILKATAACVR